MGYADHHSAQTAMQSPNMTGLKSLMSDFVKVATLEEIPAGGSLLVEVDMVRIALFNLNGEVYAIEDVCTHDGGPLVEGRVVNGCEVQCPRHGARFDIRTGAALSFPAFEPTKSLAVRVEGQDVWIEQPL
jgi:3-phenylpropionate/trans-cinnamate dioxygenase ferredoxin subunit